MFTGFFTGYSFTYAMRQVQGGLTHKDATDIMVMDFTFPEKTATALIHPDKNRRFFYNVIKHL